MQKSLKRKYNIYMLASNQETKTAASILTDFYTALVQAEMRIDGLERLLKEYERMYQEALENLAAKQEGL